MEQGFKDIVFEVIDSTQTHAKKEYENLYKGQNVAIRTFYQTHGRGQYDRKWESNSKKNILCTFVVSFFTNHKALHTLPLVTTLAVVDSIKQTPGIEVEPQIKWLNDVYINNKKFCGVLIESEQIGNELVLLVGIGINVDNSPKLESATNIKAEQNNKEFDHELLFTNLKQQLWTKLQQLNTQGFPFFTKSVVSNLMKNKVITQFVHPKTEEPIYEGFVESINDNGQLVIRDKAGLIIQIEQDVRMKI